MQVSIEEMGEGTAVIRLSGLLNAHTAPSMKEQIEVLINSGTSQLIFDLSNVDFIDSSGLAALVSGLKKVRALDGQLCLVGAKTYGGSSARKSVIHVGGCITITRMSDSSNT